MQIDQPTPELPVRNIEEAQRYVRDRMGFEIGWHHTEGRIGAVSHGECAIFLRQTTEAVHPVVLWIFATDIDAAYAELVERGAEITDPINDKPWGLRQFTARDPHGHILHFHHDKAS